MELSDYLRVLRKRWLSIVALTALALAGAAAAILLSTPQYQAHTSLFVKVAGSGDEDPSALAQGNTFVQDQVQSYATIANSYQVLRPVVARLRLGTTPSELASHVSAQAPLNTVLITITVTEPSARRAAAVANAVGASLASYVSDLERSNDASAASPVRLSTYEPAAVPPGPSSPNVKLDLALGLLVGLAVGVGLAVLREALDTTVTGEHDLVRLRVPVLAGMPFDDDARAHPLVVRDAPSSARAESFRQLRTNLAFAIATGRTRSVVVTSSVEGEGKSTTAANLALALASAGTRVALVDADLRRPTIAEYLGLEGAAGLTTVLVGRASASDVLQPWGATGKLDVLPSGEVPPNPSELLASEAMRALLAELEARYDVVLLDGAPLLPVTDSAVLAGLTGGALLVVGSGRTKRPALERSVAALRTVEAKVLGAVVTMLPTRGADAYSVYSYAYAHPEHRAGGGEADPGVPARVTAV